MITAMIAVVIIMTMVQDVILIWNVNSKGTKNGPKIILVTLMS